MGPKRARGKIPKNRSSFCWTPDLRLGMAEYVRNNYDAYKKALGSQKKMHFLRRMRDFLELQCNDLQIKNGFNFFLQKYNDVESKLAQSGFGVDPDRDASLDKGWILKQCPYYEILNEVMGTRPNLQPPFIVSTAVINHSNDESESLIEEGSLNCISPDPLEIPPTSPANSSENVEVINNGVIDIENEQPADSQQSNRLESPNDAKATKRELEHKRRDVLNTKSPLAMFAKVMTEKNEENLKIEREKLVANKEQNEAEREIQKEKLQLEMLKINSQIKIEEQRLQLEQQKADRQHEIEKLKLQQEFDLKKLEIELKYKN